MYTSVYEYNEKMSNNRNGLTSNCLNATLARLWTVRRSRAASASAAAEPRCATESAASASSTEWASSTPASPVPPRPRSRFRFCSSARAGTLTFLGRSCEEAATDVKFGSSVCSVMAAVDSVDAEEGSISGDETAAAEAVSLVSEGRVTVSKSVALVALSFTAAEGSEVALAAAEASNDSTLGRCVDDEAGGSFCEEADCLES